MQGAGEQFRSKRQQFTTQIRRLNRQQILTKRRNILTENQKQKKQILIQNSMSNTIQNQKQTQTIKASQLSHEQVNTRSKYHMLDQRFQKQIQQFQAVNVYKQPLISFVQAIHDPDIIRQHYGIIGIKKILTISKKPPIQQVIDAGLIPRLIQYAKQTEYPQLQLEAVWCLTNVASGNNSQTGPIIEKGGIKIFVDLLLSVHVGIVEQAIWVLGNIARDSSNYRDKIIKEGGLKNLIKLIQLALGQLQSNESIRQLIQSATWTLAGICQTPPNPPYLSIKQVLTVFHYVVKKDLILDQSILGNVCNAISIYTNTTKQKNQKIDKIQECINSGVVPKIISYLNHSYDNIVIACIKIIGNIANGNTQQSKYLISLNVLPQLQELLSKSKKIMRREACWVLSNLTAGSMQEIQVIFSRQSLVSKLIKMFKQDQLNIRSEICYIFANSTDHGDPVKISKFLAQLDYIRLLVQNLNCGNNELTFSVLQCLEIMLSFEKKHNKDSKTSIYVNQLHKLKAVPVLQDLQFHEEDKIYEIVSRIISKYFELEDPLRS